jgi:two-component system chemotaxis response regulator CheY
MNLTLGILSITNSIVQISWRINSNMALKVLYRFLGVEDHHTCQLTYEQYKNFRNLPIIRECVIVKRNQEELEGYKEEMQKAINLAEKNSTHILKLSQNVK